MPASALALTAVLLAPPVAEAAPSGTEAVAPADAYDLAAAKADVETILVDRGREYLDARARLEDHPEHAAAAVVARLEAVPAPGPDQRNRLLNVLAALQQPEHVELFAEQLRTAMLQKRSTELWIQLIRKQGAAAKPALVGLVGDRELSDDDRGDALDVLVDITPRDDLDELMTMVGRGSTTLQDRLRRAVIRRSRGDADDGAAIAAGIDADLDDDAGDEARTAQLLILRAACCDADAAFTARLEGVLVDEGAPFQTRVAAIDGLARIGAGEAALTDLARAQGPAAVGGLQSAEVLVTLALEALPEDARADLVTELNLAAASAPRLATLGYASGRLEDGWLARSQAHAWPSVRKAALGRVASEGAPACDKGLVRDLTRIAGPISEGGDEDSRVGRAAVTALGRCGDDAALAALRGLLDDTGVDLNERAEAAKQLVLHDPDGPDYVAGLLLDGRFSELARELAAALARAPEPTDAVRDALCRVEAGNPMVASTAHDSFVALFPGERCE